MLDEPLIPGGVARIDRKEVGVLLGRARVAHSPAVVGRQASDPGQLVVGLARGRSSGDVPGRAVPLQDEVAETLAVVVGRRLDGHAARGGGAGHALQERSNHACTRRGRTGHDRPGGAVPVLNQGPGRVPVSADPQHCPHCPAVGSADTRDVEKAPTVAGRDGRCGSEGPGRTVPRLPQRSERATGARSDVREGDPDRPHCVALAQDEPSRTSSAPVPGVVAMYQPDGVAPLPAWSRRRPRRSRSSTANRPGRAALQSHPGPTNVGVVHESLSRDHWTMLAWDGLDSVDGERRRLRPI